MKCAMITCSYGRNYGNRLQNYALQTVVEDLGHEAYTIDYTPGPQKQQAQSGKSANDDDKDEKSAQVTLTKEMKSLKKDAFKRFNRMFVNFTYYKYNYESDMSSIASKYDFFICGSDQIWNPLFRTWKDDAYFLGFAPEYKRISYAPSIALNEIAPECHAYMREMVNSIPHLSIREHSGAKILKEVTGRDAEVVLDPTLLLTEQKWDVVAEQADKSFIPDEPYVFCYFLGMTDDAKAEVDRLCEVHHCKKVQVFDMDNPGIFGAGPAEFIALIKNATVVCTDSFHGSVFSVIYQRPLHVFPRLVEGSAPDMTSRLDTLFNLLEIDSSPLKEGKAVSVASSEYKTDRLNDARKNSVEYLSQAIEFSMNSPQRVNHADLDHQGPEQNYMKDLWLGKADKKDCSGCGACLNICPAQCIDLKEDEEGFCYPSIDKKDCISCRKCEEVCNDMKTVVQAYKSDNVDIPKVYAAWSKDDELRWESSSGGVFTQLALNFVRDGGHVCGVIRQEDMTPKHILTCEESEVLKMAGSKYIPSDVGTIYREIKQKLDQGEKVLIGSLPCQITGLLSYLDKDYDNLLTCDLSCKGVCSPIIFRKYLKVHQKRADARVVKVDNRDKGEDRGWATPHTRIWFSNGEESVYSERKDIFFRTFNRGTLLRPSCYACKSKGLPRGAELTLADFWGIDKITPDLDHRAGVSLILVHSDKGRDLLKKMQDSLVLKEYTLNDGLMNNPAVFNSVKYQEVRPEVFQALSEKPFKTVIREYFPIKKKKKPEPNVIQPEIKEEATTALGKVVNGLKSIIRG